MKHLKLALFLILGLGFVGSLVHAQTPSTRPTACDPATPNNALCLQATAPAVWLEGGAVDKPLSYRIEQRVGTTGAWTTVTTGLTDLKFYVRNLAPGTYFFRWYANCATNCNEGPASNVASRDATPPITTPGAPVITIAVVIGLDHAPVYRIVSGHLSADHCGYIEVGKQCYDAVVSYRGFKFHRVDMDAVRMWPAKASNCFGPVAAPCA